MDVFTALADPTRRALLDQRQRDGHCTVSELVAVNAVSQPAISRHRRVLREAGLVTARQDGHAATGPRLTACYPCSAT